MRNRSVLALFVCSLLLGLSPLAADSVIQRGIDTFVTPANGTSFYDFAHSPIPAGFFCKGSKPFTGKVTFKGLPLATKTPGALWNADTVIERLDDAVFEKGVAMTRIQFRALSLVSTAPIKTGCGAYHVYVTLGGPQRVTTMTISRTQEAGGTFSVPLAADVRVTFVPVRSARNKAAARKLELNTGFTFQASPLPWSFTSAPRAKRIGSVVVDTNGDQAADTLLPATSNFSPGVSPESRTQSKLMSYGECPCYEGPTCHIDPSTGKQHCTYPTRPSNCPLTLCHY